MASVSSKVKIFTPKVKEINSKARIALEKTGETVLSDLVKSKMLPFGETKRDSENNVTYTGGTLEKSIHLDTSDSAKGKVSIAASTPYARRLYFHPEYNFYRGENTNAQGKWFEPYIKGSKKEYAKKAYEKLLKAEMR